MVLLCDTVYTGEERFRHCILKIVRIGSIVTSPIVTEIKTSAANTCNQIHANTCKYKQIQHHLEYLLMSFLEPTAIHGKKMTQQCTLLTPSSLQVLEPSSYKQVPRHETLMIEISGSRKPASNANARAMHDHHDL